MPHNPSKLLVVERAQTLAVAVHAYASTHARQLSELSPGIRSQLLRAATSIPLNLSEACGYHTPTRAASFLDVAIGSCNEVERVLTLCVRLGVTDPSCDSLLTDIGTVRAMTYGFRKHILSRH